MNYQRNFINVQTYPSRMCKTLQSRSGVRQQDKFRNMNNSDTVPLQFPPVMSGKFQKLASVPCLFYSIHRNIQQLQNGKCHSVHTLQSDLITNVFPKVFVYGMGNILCPENKDLKHRSIDSDSVSSDILVKQHFIFFFCQRFMLISIIAIISRTIYDKLRTPLI